MPFIIVGFRYFGRVIQETHLQNIVDEIEIDIKNEDFDSARIKASSLTYVGDWDTEYKWFDIRQTIEKTIEEAQKE